MTEYKYDLFIVYSSENTKEARKLMEDIERRFCIKCCFADRDFVPGAEIVENISNAMEWSDKIVMLISQHFVDSGWCWFEEQEAFRKYIQEKRNCIIPVKLEDVEMPKRLRNMTYVDFQKESDPAAKVYHAYLHPSLEVHFRKILYSYDDGFEDAEERLEFLRDEVDEKTLQNYFDEAVRHQDTELLQCILQNNHTKLTSKNIFNCCVHLRKDDFNQELVESIFQKLPHDLTIAGYEYSYLVVCSRDIPCLVSKFNTLGCHSLIDATFVCKLITARPLKCTDENDMFMGILKDTRWVDDDLQSFLDIAIQSRRPVTIKVLLSLVSTIPFQKFFLLVFEMDEETCVEVFQREKYQDGKNLLAALQKACVMNMKTLVREILKQGVKLQPVVLLPDFSFGIVEILIKEYPWCPRELHEIEKVLTNPRSKRLLKSEIQKKTETAESFSTDNGSINTDKCTVLYERNA